MRRVRVLVAAVVLLVALTGCRHDLSDSEREHCLNYMEAALRYGNLADELYKAESLMVDDMNAGLSRSEAETRDAPGSDITFDNMMAEARKMQKELPYCRLASDAEYRVYGPNGFG